MYSLALGSYDEDVEDVVVVLNPGGLALKGGFKIAPNQVYQSVGYLGIDFLATYHDNYSQTVVVKSTENLALL